MYPWLVLAPLLGLVCTVAVHFLLAWLTGGRRAYGCVLRGFVGGGLATLAVSVIALWKMNSSAGEWLALLPFNLVIFAALGFGYINFVGLSIASLRIRVVQEILAHPHGLSRETLLERYNPHVLIDNRITRLTTGRQLVEKDGRFYNERSGVLWIARLMNLLKLVVLGRRPARHSEPEA